MEFKGAAIVFESLEESQTGILDGAVQPGHVVIIRYEGPSGGPEMQEMLHPTAYIKSKGLEHRSVPTGSPRVILRSRISSDSTGHNRTSPLVASIARRERLWC